MLKVCSGCQQEREASEFRKGSRCRECEREYQRHWYWVNPERARAKSQRSVAKRRADPTKAEAIRTSQRKHYHSGGGKERDQAYFERMKDNDPWGWRSRNLRRNVNPTISVEWLRLLWDG